MGTAINTWLLFALPEQREVILLDVLLEGCKIGAETENMNQFTPCLNLTSLTILLYQYKVGTVKKKKQYVDLMGVEQ